MTDIREGRIQAFLDGEMSDVERAAFVADMNGDPELARTVSDQRDRVQHVGETLRRFDEHATGGGVVDVEGARKAILGRLDASDLEHVARLGSHKAQPAAEVRTTGSGTATGTTGTRFTASRLRWAAGLVLFASGAAAATIPGSPLRGLFGADDAGPGIEPAAITEIAAPESVGVRVSPVDGRLEIALSDGIVNGSLTVPVTDQDDAEVLAGAGTRFRTGAGRLDITEVVGDLRLSLPGTAQSVTVFVGDQIYVRKIDERVEVLGPGVDTIDAEFVFSPPGDDGEDGEDGGAPESRDDSNR